MNTHDRMMAKRDSVLDTIVNMLPRTAEFSEPYEKQLDRMYEELSESLVIPKNKVIAIESTCVGYVDYAEKFALRLSFEYFGVE